MSKLIPIGINKPESGSTTIINENGVDYSDRIEALENAQGIKTAATGKVFVAWTGVGYEYEVTYPLYYINGEAFPPGSKKITLDGSHATLDRIDTFGLNASGVFAIAGEPAAEPLAPTVDTANEIFITTRDVKANTTEPEPDSVPVANVDVYKENTEWTGTAELVSTNFNNTSNPYSGTKSIRIRSGFELKDTLNTHNKNEFAALRLKIVLNYQGTGYAAFEFQFLLNGVAVSSIETIRAGFDFQASSTEYVTALLDFDKFVFSSNTFNTIKVTPIKANKFTGSSLFDDITLIAGSVNVVSSPSVSIDTSPFVLKSSFGWFPINPTGVVIDYNLESVGSSSFALFGTATEMHSIRYSNFNPIVYRGQDFYFRNDQATDIVFKHEALARIQERFVFTSPDETDIVVKPKEIVHFKAYFTEYNGGALEYVGKVVDLGKLISTATEKTTIHDEDKVGIADFEDSDKTKFWKWSTIVSKLTEIFNLIYAVPQITITTAVSITTDTLSGVLSQKGRNVIIDNGVNAINITVNGGTGFCASYVKQGTGAITFVQGAGRTLVQVDATAVLGGIAGSTATITSVGTTDYLRISNG